MRMCARCTLSSCVATCLRTAAASIKSDKPVAISQVLSHKTKPNQMIFVSAADHMW